MSRAISLSAGILGIALLSLGLPMAAHAQAKPAPHRYYHYHHALWELRDAREEIKDAKNNFGEHKEKALAVINDAIKQLDFILANLEVKNLGDPVRGDLKAIYKAYGTHPHLNHALVELREAQAQLHEDKHNYGGHKDAALRDIHLAIEQIDLLLHRYYHLHHALWELRDARKELAETKHNFGEHKEKSLAAMNDAIRELELVIKNLPEGDRAEPTRGDLRVFYGTYADHPHTHHALTELRAAELQLKESKLTFGGHREAAERDIHRAVVQLELMFKK